MPEMPSATAKVFTAAANKASEAAPKIDEFFEKLSKYKLTDNKFVDAHKLLGLDPTVGDYTTVDYTKAYRKVVLKLHPDKLKLHDIKDPAKITEMTDKFKTVQGFKDSTADFNLHEIDVYKSKCRYDEELAAKYNAAAANNTQPPQHPGFMYNAPPPPQSAPRAGYAQPQPNMPKPNGMPSGFPPGFPPNFPPPPNTGFKTGMPKTNGMPNNFPPPPQSAPRPNYGQPPKSAQKPANTSPPQNTHKPATPQPQQSAPKTGNAQPPKAAANPAKPTSYKLTGDLHTDAHNLMGLDPKGTYTPQKYIEASKKAIQENNTYKDLTSTEVEEFNKAWKNIHTIEDFMASKNIKTAAGAARPTNIPPQQTTPKPTKTPPPQNATRPNNIPPQQTTPKTNIPQPQQYATRPASPQPQQATAKPGPSAPNTSSKPPVKTTANQPIPGNNATNPISKPDDDKTMTYGILGAAIPLGLLAAGSSNHSMPMMPGPSPCFMPGGQQYYPPNSWQNY